LTSPDHAALVDRSQDGDLIVVGPAEGAAVVQVDGVSGVAKNLEISQAGFAKSPDLMLK